METTGNYLLLPSADQLGVVKLLLLVVFLVHLPYIGMTIGGSLLSVIFNLRDQRKHNPIFARLAWDTIDTIAYNKSVGVIFGFLPLVVIFIALALILYQSGSFSFVYLALAILLAFVGLALVFGYKQLFARRDKLSLLIGFGGHAVLILAYFFLLGNFTHFFDPEKWPFVQNPLDLVLSWKTIAKFLHFSTLALAITGVSLVFFLLHWRKKTDRDPDYESFVLKLGAGIGLFFTLVQPVFLLFDLINTVDVSLSRAVFAGTAMMLVLLFIISLLLLKMLSQSRARLGPAVAIIYLLFFLVLVLNDGWTREKAIEVHTRGLLAKAQAVKDEIHDRRLAAGAVEIVADAQAGEKVFNNRCTACHQFDARLVGPPLHSVLPKYVDNVAELKSYLASPQKKNPEYPAMPNLGLSSAEIESVTAYVLSQAQNK